MLKSIQKPTHLRNFAGQTLGIDAYGWLHRGTVSCAIELAQQKPTRKHIDFALSRVRMLIHFGVKPYIVFDGDYLPSKAHTEKERAGRRKESKKLGLELLAMGRVSQAHLELQKAVDVTPSMARELIEELKRMDVPYVVAPYEADSQLAYLEKQGLIHGVLSEDSDLLVFGVTRLLTKLDQYGECVMVNRKDFTACREVSLVGWSDVEFRMMAMLSGCDYLPGIERMGLKTAYRLVRKHKTLDRVIRTVQFDGKMKVPAGYIDAFTKAERTFLYQWVFCPEARSLVNLNTLPADIDVESLPFLGKQVQPELAVGVAVGDLDPNTKEPLPIPSRPDRQPFGRTRPVQTPDEKQGKPITEFFKARRTPLAELDPNSFTPSPSQQRLLENRRSTSWSASQAQPLPPQALTRIASAHAPSSAPQPSRRITSAPFPDRQRRSPKRQRLCADGILASSADDKVGSQQATSRFFSNSTAQPSPSLRKATNKKRDDFELWADDSVAEAAAVLTATQVAAVAVSVATPSPKKRKKLQVFADEAPKSQPAQKDDVPALVETSQESSTMAATAGSQIRKNDDTPPTSFEASQSQSQSQKTVFGKGIASDFAALRSKFSFEPKRSVPRTQSAPLASQRSSQQAAHNSLTGRLAKVPPRAETLVKRHMGSPLHSPVNTDMEQSPVVPASSPIAAPSPAPEEDEIDDAEWLALEREPVPQRQQLTLEVHGSEDMLVPNSSPDSGGDDGRTRPKIDFGRFAFAG